MIEKLVNQDKSSKNSKSKKTLLCSVTATAGVLGTVIWQKRDLLKSVALLTNKKKKWVLIDTEPETYFTTSQPEAQEELFAYFTEHQWRLADQFADGYFWLNDDEEIILLQQKKVLKDKYCLWTASKSFGIVTE